MKFTTLLLSLSVITMALASEKSKSRPTVVYPVLEVQKDVSTQKTFYKVENIMIDEFNLEDFSMNDAVALLVRKSREGDKKYKEGLNIIRMSEGDFGQAVKPTATWEDMSPLTFGKVVDKLCSEFSLKWSVGKYSVSIAKEIAVPSVKTSSFTITPVFIKVILNFPYLKTNKTKFRKVRLTEKNLKKGFARLGIVLDEPCQLKSNYINYIAKKNGSRVYYDSKTQQLQVTNCRAEALKRLENLIVRYKEQRGGWRPFYDYLKAEDEIIQFKKRLNKIVITKFELKNEMPKTAFNQLAKIVEGLHQGIKIVPEFEDNNNTGTVSLKFNNMPVSDVQYLCNATCLHYKIKGNQFIIKRTF